jgi:hypothetical protein
LAKPQRSISREVASIRRSLSSIGAALGRLTPRLEQMSRRSAAGRPAAPRAGTRIRLSPERRASLQLQGQYIGYMRTLKPRQKAQVKTLREAKGIQAAIALARKLGER